MAVYLVDNKGDICITFKLYWVSLCFVLSPCNKRSSLKSVTFTYLFENLNVLPIRDKIQHHLDWTFATEVFNTIVISLRYSAEHLSKIKTKLINLKY